MLLPSILDAKAKFQNIALIQWWIDQLSDLANEGADLEALLQLKRTFIKMATGIIASIIVLAVELELLIYSGVAAAGARSSIMYKVPRGGHVTRVERMRNHVRRAARQVDHAGDQAFSVPQLAAIKRSKNPEKLRALFRGNRIDVKARQHIMNDPDLTGLISNYTRGPDFEDVIREGWGGWYDMTTPSQWPAHVRKYGEGGAFLTADITFETGISL